MPKDLFSMVEKEIGIDYRSKFYIDVERLLKKLSVIFRQEITKDTSNNFELFGLDLLIDQAFHMHLLEVNLSAHC